MEEEDFGQPWEEPEVAWGQQETGGKGKGKGKGPARGKGKGKGKSSNPVAGV